MKDLMEGNDSDDGLASVEDSMPPTKKPKVAE